MPVKQKNHTGAAWRYKRPDACYQCGKHAPGMIQARPSVAFKHNAFFCPSCYLSGDFKHNKTAHWKKIMYGKVNDFKIDKLDKLKVQSKDLA